MLTRSTQILLALGAVATLACAPTAETATPNGDTTGVETDLDVRPAEATALPSGYQGRTDRANQQLTDARYAAVDNGWEVTTGPAHILWSGDHTASGNYTVSATFEQLQRPQHPEAFGIFIGGRDLDGAGQAYTYFLVRGTGEAFAQRRDGTNLTQLKAWTASPAVAAADEAGRQTYRMEVRVASDSVRFFVNGNQAVAVARDAVQTDGIAGLRINHNLNVRVTPIQITRR
jgi:hypothetical protein